MINLNANKITKILGLYGFDGINECMRECVREYYRYESEFVENVATEYSKNFKQIAIDDFSMETGLDVEEAELFNLESDILIKPDGICSDRALLQVFCSYKDKELKEFDSANESRKIMIYSQYAMLVSGYKKCHVIQWNHNTSKIETIKFSKKFIEQTKPIIEGFVEDAIYAISNDSERHLTKIDNSAKAKSAVDSYNKAQGNLVSAINKLNSATDNLNSFCDKKPINVAGLLLTPNDNGVEIS